MIEQINDSIHSNYIMIQETKIPVSIAMGASIFEPSTDRTYEDVFDKADHAMYINKTNMKVVRE